VAAISPRISFPGAVFRDESTFGLQGKGIDFTLEREYQDLSRILVSGKLPDQAEAEGRRVPAVIGNGVAERLDLGIGDSFTLLATTMSRGSNAMTFQVSGILDFPVSGLNNVTFLAPLPAVQRLLRMEEAVTEILVKSEEGYTPGQVAAALSRTVAGVEQRGELSVQPWTEIRTTYSFMEIARVTYSFIALFFFILGSTVIINTIMMTVFERKQEIGTLAALGMDRREVTRLFFYEAAIMSFLGSLLGVIVGSAVVLPLSQTGIDFTQAMQGVSMEVSDVIYPMLQLRTILGVLLVSTVVAAIASYLPVRGVARIEPVEALRSE
jgi:putative ABC transport system permease protein